jgi:hypothetical protein
MLPRRHRLAASDLNMRTMWLFGPPIEDCSAVGWFRMPIARSGVVNKVMLTSNFGLFPLVIDGN